MKLKIEYYPNVCKWRIGPKTRKKILFRPRSGNMGWMFIAEHCRSHSLVYIKIWCQQYDPCIYATGLAPRPDVIVLSSKEKTPINAFAVLAKQTIIHATTHRGRCLEVKKAVYVLDGKGINIKEKNFLILPKSHGMQFSENISKTIVILAAVEKTVRSIQILNSVNAPTCRPQKRTMRFFLHVFSAHTHHFIASPSITQRFAKHGSSENPCEALAPKCDDIGETPL